MYFKSLELIGFKSFAEKTTLNFEPGVTAIVGPNGTGKSNVADAIRWALGEQSTKSLRASLMEDVIFNGTDTKEPINFAEVSITLSNEKRIFPLDYDEVTITRRIFRSGENEYLLNKTVVRLKDITDILMGTGIGTESYSIIEQGKIDLILSSRPEDRRYVFEEASGITKYKSKKKEALRKLEQTEQNILRINDIIQEVKRQISSIERQARKAEKYKADFDRLKDMEVRLSFYEFKNLKAQEKTHMVESLDAKEREKNFSSDIEATASKISGYRQSLDELNRKASDLKSAFSEKSGAHEMNAHKAQIDKERIEEAGITQDGLKGEIKSISEKISSGKKAIEKSKTDLEKVSQERIAKIRSIEEKELLAKDLADQIKRLDEKIKISKLQVVDYLSKSTRIKNDLIKLGADVQNKRARKTRLIIEKESVEKERTAIDELMRAIVNESKEIETTVSGLKASLESKRLQSDTAASAIEELKTRIAKEENEKVSTRSKIEFLEDLVKKHEGYKSGVKNLLSAIEKGAFGNKGIIGVLADIINVKRGYEEAVNTFLGDHAQVVITECDSDIRTFIRYLEDSRLGKACFVSLETLKGLNAESASSVKGSLKSFTPLKDFVKTDKRYEKVVEYFFRDAYLVESLEDALKGLDEGIQTAFVTVKGHMYDCGRFSGGSITDKDELLIVGRKDRLEDFKSHLKELDKDSSLLEAELDAKMKEMTGLASRIKILEEDLHQGEINLENIKVKINSQGENLKKIDDESSLLDLELDEVNEAIGELTKKGESLNSELNEIEKEHSAFQLAIDESQGLILNNRAKTDALMLEIATLKTETQGSEKEEASLNNSLKKEEASLFELEESLYSKEGLLSESIDKARSLEDEISNLKLENDAISKELKNLEEESAKLENMRSELADRLNIDEPQLEENSRCSETLRNQIRDLDVKLTELNYKKTSLKERIFQAYKVDLEGLHIELENDTPWDALKTQVAELSDRLEKMGPVNLVAIDEFKELEERHSFLTHQHEDLLNAKESLLKAIQKINTTTKELFIETFQKIQIEFKNFFRMLFGGGQAELILIDEHDVLESGIEIIVRPPGKKLQNIMLLSGGEKALTAIALLFSIFKVKPSPFCVLDEIDAPLDESNIDRFSRVLSDFLKISQFIIITHNKRTIELADILYGITMQERGVSKIVSVKFLDDRKKEDERVGALA